MYSKIFQRIIENWTVIDDNCDDVSAISVTKRLLTWNQENFIAPSNKKKVIELSVLYGGTGHYDAAIRSDHMFGVYYNLEKGLLADKFFI